MKKTFYEEIIEKKDLTDLLGDVKRNEIKMLEKSFIVKVNGKNYVLEVRDNKYEEVRLENYYGNNYYFIGKSIALVEHEDYNYQNRVIRHEVFQTKLKKYVIVSKRTNCHMEISISSTVQDLVTNIKNLPHTEGNYPGHPIKKKLAKKIYENCHLKYLRDYAFEEEIK